MATSIHSLTLDIGASDSDDESFVVLSSSLPQESLLEIRREDIEAIDQEPIQQSIDSANEALNELTNSDKLPSLPKVENLTSVNGNLIPADTTSSLKSNASELSPTEVQQKIDALIEENSKLKDALLQNHLTLKKQYDTIAMWNEDVQKVHEIHKKKFAETKEYVEKLKIENSKLKENLQVAESTISCLQDELDSLKGRDSNIKQLNADLYKNTIENLSKFELDVAQKKITELENQLSNMKLCSGSDEILAKLTAENARLKEENEKLSKEIIEEQKHSVLKQSKLFDEIDSLVANQAMQSNSDKEVIDNLKEQLCSTQKQLMNMGEAYKKDRDLMIQKEKELNDYKEGLHSLQARVVDPAIIEEKNRRIDELEKMVQELKGEIEVVPILKEQLDIFKADFEAEREAKNSLKSQKESLSEDLSNLQRRNQQLLEEVERLRAATGNNPTIGRPRPSENIAGAPQEQSPPTSQRFTCPLCMQSFRTVRFLEDHVDVCLQNEGH